MIIDIKIYVHDSEMENLIGSEYEYDDLADCTIDTDEIAFVWRHQYNSICIVFKSGEQIISDYDYNELCDIMKKSKNIY